MFTTHSTRASWQEVVAVIVGGAAVAAAYVGSLAVLFGPMARAISHVA